ncbi:MAG: ABC transporter permease [Actinomycetota bacterium]
MSALVADTSILARRAIVRSARNPASIMSAVLFPLLFLGLFNLVMRRVMAAQGFDYAQLLPSTVVIQAMMFAGMSAAYYVADDRTTGMLSRLRSLPIHRASPLLARTFADAARSLLSIAVVVGVGVATGMRFTAGAAAAAGYVLVAVAFAVTMSLGMGLIGLVAPTRDSAASLASIPYLPLIMLSSGFAPVDDFPGWLQPFVEWQPVTSAIDALRALAGDGDISTTVTRTVMWSVVLVLVFTAMSVRLTDRAVSR